MPKLTSQPAPWPSTGILQLEEASALFWTRGFTTDGDWIEEEDKEEGDEEW